MSKDLSLVNDIVFICNGNSCLKKGAEENTAALRSCIKDNNLDACTHTIKTRCSGQCKEGPVVFVYPDGVWYKNIDLEKSGKIVTSHLLKRAPLQDNVLFKPSRRSFTFKSLFGKLRFFLSLLVSGLFLLTSAIGDDTAASSIRLAAHFIYQ